MEDRDLYAMDHWQHAVDFALFAGATLGVKHRVYKDDQGYWSVEEAKTQEASS